MAEPMLQVREVSKRFGGLLAVDRASFAAAAGRITALIGSGKFYTDLGIEPLNPETDRVMICGSMEMLKDVKELAENHGFVEGSLSSPASFVVERAFVG